MANIESYFQTPPKANTPVHHLAILQEPYLTLIFQGKKTEESRMYRYKSPPWKQVRKGDIIYLKRSSGPVLGQAEAAYVEFIEIASRSHLENLFALRNAKILATEEFQAKKMGSKYVILIGLKNVVKWDTPQYINKHSQNAWVVGFLFSDFSFPEKTTKICPKCEMPMIYERIPTMDNPKRVDWCCENINCGYRTEARWRPES